MGLKRTDYLKKTIRSIPDYPKKGIVFRDLSTLFLDEKALGVALDLLADHLKEKQSGRLVYDKLAGIEARGFLLAGALAGKFGGGVVMLRKPGKLPYKKRRIEYKLEYGEDALEIHEDAIRSGDRIVVVDDLLATGGTAKAGCQLVEELGGVVIKTLFLVELPDLGGRKKLSGYTVDSIIEFEGE